MDVHVQVTYAQGLVKSFIADSDVTVSRFIDVTRAIGRVRSMRFKDVGIADADRMVAAGEAIRVRSGL
jgi:hypothetical protein